MVYGLVTQTFWEKFGRNYYAVTCNVEPLFVQSTLKDYSFKLSQDQNRMDNFSHQNQGNSLRITALLNALVIKLYF